MRRRRSISGGAAALALVPLACGGGGGGQTVTGPPPDAPAAMQVTSPAFAGGASIPRRFTCDGANAAPTVAWTGVPAKARTLALTLEDPDAPGGTFVHWTVYDLPPTAARVAGGRVPAGARQGANSFGKRGYGGPCPPKGDRPHRYVFSVYALRTRLDLKAGARPGDVRSAIARAALARGRLTGRYGR
jgi:Raf kinase inhibitor-like YbhB/YbcL family protein